LRKGWLCEETEVIHTGSSTFHAPVMGDEGQKRRVITARKGGQKDERNWGWFEATAQFRRTSGNRKR